MNELSTPQDLKAESPINWTPLLKCTELSAEQFSKAFASILVTLLGMEIAEIETQSLKVPVFIVSILFGRVISVRLVQP